MCQLVFHNAPLNSVANSTLPACGCVVFKVTFLVCIVYIFKKKRLLFCFCLHDPTENLDRIKSWHLNLELRTALLLPSANVHASMDFI